MPNVDFDAIAKGLAMAVPFAGYLGLEITEVGAGEATVVLPRRPELNNHVGSQHAGALFTAAETASGAAFVGAFAESAWATSPRSPSRPRSTTKRSPTGAITAKAKLGMRRRRGARDPRRARARSSSPAKSS